MAVMHNKLRGYGEAIMYVFVLSSLCSAVESACIEYWFLSTCISTIIRDGTLFGTRFDTDCVGPGLICIPQWQGRVEEAESVLKVCYIFVSWSDISISKI